MKNPTEGGIELIFLCSIMRDDLLESTKQSCYNKKNEQTNKEVEIWDQSPTKDRRWIWE